MTNSTPEQLTDIYKTIRMSMYGLATAVSVIRIKNHRSFDLLGKHRLNRCFGSFCMRRSDRAD